MSTRATIHFTYDGKEDAAIIYRHSDGYPTKPGLKYDLKDFFKDIKENVKDNRFDDPSYLAAKWVVWDALRYHERSSQHPWLSESDKQELKHPCNFLGVGIVTGDPGDIEYRYTIDCSKRDKNGYPKLTWTKV